MEKEYYVIKTKNGKFLYINEEGQYDDDEMTMVYVSESVSPFNFKSWFANMEQVEEFMADLELGNTPDTRYYGLTLTAIMPCTYKKVRLFCEE